MSDILSTNPKLGDVLKRAVDRIGQNHAQAKDDHGMVISNEGKSHKYTPNNGVHPSRIGQEPTKGTEIYKVLGEQDNTGEEEKTVAQLEKELEKEIQKIKTGVNGHPASSVEMKIKSVTAKYKKLIDAAKQKEEMDEATSAGAAGSYVGPLFANEDDEKEADEIMESVIKEKVNDVMVLEEKIEKMVEDELEETGAYGTGLGLNYSEKRPAYNFKSQGPFQGRMTGPGYNFESGGPLREIKERIVKKIKQHIEEQYTEKPTTKGGFKKGTPGIEVTDKTFKVEKKDSEDYYDMVDKKMKEYLDIKFNSHSDFPHQNMSKTDYESPMYRNNTEQEDFIDDFRGMGLEDANDVENLDRLSDYLSGSQETGNAQTDKEGKPLANVVPSKLGEKIKKKIARKKKVIAKRKSKMSNLRGMTPDVQTVNVVS